LGTGLFLLRFLQILTMVPLEIPVALSGALFDIFFSNIQVF